MKQLGIVILGIAMLALIVAPATAKKDNYIERFDAVATSVQGGSGGMQILRFMISEWTTPEDREAMIKAFDEGGATALADWMGSQSEKAVVMTAEGKPYYMMYAFQWEQDGNRKIYMATDRPISGLETMAGSQRSLRYNISLVEIVFEADKKKGTGTMVLGAELTVDESGKLKIEAAALQPIRFTSVKDKMK